MARYENGVYYNDNGSVMSNREIKQKFYAPPSAPVATPAPAPATDAVLSSQLLSAQYLDTAGKSMQLKNLLSQGYDQNTILAAANQLGLQGGNGAFGAADFDYLNNFQAPAAPTATQPVSTGLIKQQMAPAAAAQTPVATQPMATQAPSQAPTQAPAAAPQSLASKGPNESEFQKLLTRRQAESQLQQQAVGRGDDTDSFVSQGMAQIDQNFGTIDRQKVAQELRQAIANGEDLNQFYGDTYDDSFNLLSDLGIVDRGGKDGTRILDASPTGYKGAWKFDPTFGSEYYKDAAQTVGKELGLSEDQIRKAAGQYALETLYNPSNKGFDGGIGDPVFLAGMTKRLIQAAGKDPNDQKFSEVVQKSKEYAGEVSKALYSESNESGVFKQIGQGLQRSGPFGLAVLAAATGGAAAAAGLTGATATVASAAAAGALPSVLQGDFKQGLINGALSAATAGIGAGVEGSGLAGKIGQLASRFGVTDAANQKIIGDLGAKVLGRITGAAITGQDISDAAIQGLTEGVLRGAITKIQAAEAAGTPVDPVEIERTVEQDIQALTPDTMKRLDAMIMGMSNTEPGASGFGGGEVDSAPFGGGVTTDGAGNVSQISPPSFGYTTPEVTKDFSAPAYDQKISGISGTNLAGSDFGGGRTENTPVPVGGGVTQQVNRTPSGQVFGTTNTVTDVAGSVVPLTPNQTGSINQAPPSTGETNAVNKVIDSILQGGGGSQSNTPATTSPEVPTKATETPKSTEQASNAYKDLDSILAFDWKKRKAPTNKNVLLEDVGLINSARLSV